MRRLGATISLAESSVRACVQILLWGATSLTDEVIRVVAEALADGKRNVAHKSPAEDFCVSDTNLTRS